MTVMRDVYDEAMNGIIRFGAALNKLGEAYIRENRCPKCFRHSSPDKCGRTITPTKGGDGFKCSGYRCAVWKGER